MKPWCTWVIWVGDIMNTICVPQKTLQKDSQVSLETIKNREDINRSFHWFLFFVELRLDMFWRFLLIIFFENPSSFPLDPLSHSTLPHLPCCVVVHIVPVVGQIHYYQPTEVRCGMLNIFCPDICRYFQLLEKVSWVHLILKPVGPFKTFAEFK